jgi:integrase
VIPDLQTVVAEAVAAALAQAGVVVAVPAGQDPQELSDTFIAGVVDGAFSKGIEMRNVQRVDGPYAHGSRFRLRVVEVGSRRRYITYATEADADKAKTAFAKTIEKRSGWTVDEALGEYEKILSARQNKPRGIVTTLGRLRVYFEPMLKEKVAQLTEVRAAQLLTTLAKRPSRQGDTLAVDTRKNILAEAKTFASWLTQGGHIKAGVFEGLKVEGKRRRGKQRLRYTETDRWYAEAMVMAREGDEGALAVLVAYDGNLRSSEVWRRVVRDLDRDCSILWVEDAKTEAGNRPVDLSPEVAELLRERVKGKGQDARVFSEAEALRDPKGWMIRAAGRVCRKAGVPRVTPHGLRGSGATTDVLDEVVARVSKQLGHTNTGVTVAHYLDNEVLAQLQRLLARSQRGPKEVPRRSQRGPSDRQRDPQKHESPGKTGASECGRGESNSHSITATRT